jgi:hypothetical protein
MEEDAMYPLTDDAAAEICAIIKSNIPSTPCIQLTQDDIARHCNLQVPEEFKAQYMDILFKHQDAISFDKYNLGLARNYKDKIHLKMKTWYTGNNLRYRKLTTTLSNRPWRNGTNWE